MFRHCLITENHEDYENYGLIFIRKISEEALERNILTITKAVDPCATYIGTLERSGKDNEEFFNNILKQFDKQTLKNYVIAVKIEKKKVKIHKCARF